MPRVTSITQRQLTVSSLSLPQVINTGLSFDSSVEIIAVQTDGKILVGGTFTTHSSTSQNRIVRFNADGIRDAGFTTGTGFNSSVLAIALQTDGKILLVGDFSLYNGVAQNRITRLNADGTRDTGFTTGSGFNGSVTTIALQTDGKILVGGIFTLIDGNVQSNFARLNANGTRDTGFTAGTGSSVNGDVDAIVVQTDGKILPAGKFTSYNGTTQNRITRLNADGTRDTGFVIGTGLTGDVETMALQTDGKILVGGWFTSYNGTTQNYITRLNADGTRDTGFVIGTGFNSRVYAIAVQSDGKILVGGNFTSYNGTTQNYITRLNADGTRDTGFVIGTGFNGVVYAIAVQPDGTISVGGSFSSYNGTTQNRITRLTSLGQIQFQTSPVPTYSQGAGGNNTNEGSALTITINTTNVNDGTVLRWRILDRPNDFAVNTDVFTITANSGTFSVTPTADESTEGSETFRVQVEKLAGTVILTTSNLTINDTSINSGAVAFQQGVDGVAVYQLTSTINTKYSGTPTIGGEATTVAFSPVGSKLAIGSTASPYIQVYSTDSGTLTIGSKYSDPAVAPADGTGITPSAAAIAFHPNNNAIAMVRFGGIDVWAWDPVTGFGTKYAYPSQSLFTGSNNTVTGVQWSPSGNDIAISHLGAPFISVYPWSAASGFGTKYTDPAHPAFKVSSAYNVVWHPSGNAIAFSHFGGTSVDSEFVQVWSWTSGTGFGTRYTPPAGVPGNQHGAVGYSVAWSPAGTEIVLGTGGFGDGSVVPRIHAWPWTNASGFGTKYANPATPLGNTNPGGIHFTKDLVNPTLIIGLQNISPWVATYAWSTSGFGVKLADPATPLVTYPGTRNSSIAVK
jgi:uncharacterized delta-60 repeat protein